ncbi:UNKNOWN [Stylonychia lemnae]|uniref:Uncharacterized protein n=1 Tax=Stylonychia lemnae TaxID=5949 RepID=A0A078BB25_STYLE|nr:UNKNOWN [Stylonychia lemnae]|eukprot:CDW91775.1 UNKNOWN [Stylonychia lemnae]
MNQNFKEGLPVINDSNNNSINKESIQPCYFQKNKQGINQMQPSQENIFEKKFLVNYDRQGQFSKKSSHRKSQQVDLHNDISLSKISHQISLNTTSIYNKTSNSAKRTKSQLTSKPSQKDIRQEYGANKLQDRLEGLDVIKEKRKH